MIQVNRRAKVAIPDTTEPDEVIDVTEFRRVRRKGGVRVQDVPVSKYKKAYSASKIAGVEPDKISTNGACLYSEEQLDNVRASLPDVEIDGHERAAAYSIREKQVTQVEVLLLKGLTNLNVLASIIQCSRQHMSGLVKAVHTKWELIGGPRNAPQIKGEAIAKLSLLENEYWSLFAKEHTPISTKVAILSSIVGVIDRKMLIHGLSPKVLEMIAKDKAGDSEVMDTAMDKSQNVQDNLQEATRAVLQLLAQTANVYSEQNQDEDIE